MIGIVAPHTSWKSTIDWAQSVEQSGVDAIWCADERDPIVFLSALSQMVSDLRLGLFVSAISDRPAILAARQLITLDHLCDGRLELAVDDEVAYNEIRAFFHGQLPTGSRMRIAPVWSVNGVGVGKPAIFRETFSLEEIADLQERDVRCVIARSITA